MCTARRARRPVRPARPRRPIAGDVAEAGGERRERSAGRRAPDRRRRRRARPEGITGIRHRATAAAGGADDHVGRGLRAQVAGSGNALSKEPNAAAVVTAVVWSVVIAAFAVGSTRYTTPASTAPARSTPGAPATRSGLPSGWFVEWDSRLHARGIRPARVGRCRCTGRCRRPRRRRSVVRRLAVADRARKVVDQGSRVGGLRERGLRRAGDGLPVEDVHAPDARAQSRAHALERGLALGEVRRAHREVGLTAAVHVTECDRRAVARTGTPDPAPRAQAGCPDSAASDLPKPATPAAGAPRAAPASGSGRSPPSST